MFNRRNVLARKLTGYEVQQIRKAYNEGATQGALARAYGMSVGQIGRIVRGESWSTGFVEQAPSTEEMDQLALRLQKVQEQVKASPPVSAPLAPVHSAIPPSLLDGGDAPDETQGAGLMTIAEKAKEFGAGEKK